MRQRIDNKAAENTSGEEMKALFKQAQWVWRSDKIVSGMMTPHLIKRKVGWWLGCWLNMLRWPVLPNKSPETGKDLVLAASFPG